MHDARARVAAGLRSGRARVSHARGRARPCSPTAHGAPSEAHRGAAARRGTTLARLTSRPPTGRAANVGRHPARSQTLKKIAAILLSACPVVLASCGEDALGPSDVQGEWRLVSLQQADLATTIIPDPSRFTARFQDAGRVALRADCNVCNGRYSIQDGALVSGSFACTRAFCASAPLDTQFVALLEGRASTLDSGDRLVLTSDRGRLVFER